MLLPSGKYNHQQNRLNLQRPFLCLVTLVHPSICIFLKILQTLEESEGCLDYGPLWFNWENAQAYVLA